MVVLLAGRWEVVDRLYQGNWTNILHPTYAAYVKSQLEQASQLVTDTRARDMVFLTAPCTDEGEQPDGAAWPEDNPARLAVYNKLVREVAAEHPHDATRWSTSTRRRARGASTPPRSTACPSGTSDGVHFTSQGGSAAGARDHAGHRRGRAGADGRNATTPTSAGG